MNPFNNGYLRAKILNNLDNLNEDILINILNLLKPPSKLYLSDLQHELWDNLLNNLNKLDEDELKEILNLLQPKKHNPNNLYLNGVRKFSYYRHRGLNKRIYLLYDRHDANGTCRYHVHKNYISVSHWILNTIVTNENSKNPMLIDLFLETGEEIFSNKFSKENIIPGMHGLIPVIGEYNNCLYRHDKKCPYDNIRAHWTDIRQNFSIYTKFWIYYYETIKLSEQPSGKLGPLSPDIKNILHDPISYFNKVLNLPRIKKQFDNITEADIRDKLKEYLLARVAQEKFKYDNRVNTNNYEIAMSRFYIIATITILLMDSYLLARLFRTFNVPEKDKENAKVTNAIIFVGGIHATNYELFFQKLGFEEVYSVGNFDNDYDNIACYVKGSSPCKKIQYEQCLDIENLPIPLFQ